MDVVFKPMKSPVGLLKLVADDRGLVAILWENDNPKRVRLGPEIEDPQDPTLLLTEWQLNEYFAGERKTYQIPLAPRGTPFQTKVWRALLTIPHGETRSYGAVAQQIGSPTAVRAVGAANGRNPISIVTPCHRVIGSTGALTGFAGGLATKRFLLDLEAPSAAFALDTAIAKNILSIDR